MGSNVEHRRFVGGRIIGPVHIISIRRFSPTGKKPFAVYHAYPVRACSIQTVKKFPSRIGMARKNPLKMSITIFTHLLRFTHLRFQTIVKKLFRHIASAVLPKFHISFFMFSFYAVLPIFPD